jgi:upstream-binding transcription factor
MAETVAEMPIGPVRTRKPRTNRKALKEKNPSANEANIMVEKVSQPSPNPVAPADDPEKENHESLSQPRSGPKKGKAVASKKQSKQKQQSFEQDLLEMQEKLQQLRLEKEKTDELLKAKDEMLQQKEEELENRGRQQEKLQIELKKLQKLKEFKPTVVRFLELLGFFFWCLVA